MDICIFEYKNKVKNFFTISFLKIIHSLFVMMIICCDNISYHNSRLILGYLSD